VHDVIEGFAKYREFWAATAHYPMDDAIRIVFPTAKGMYARAGAYLQERLGIEYPIGLVYPLVGALLELSVISFVDPWLCPDDGPLLWENIHPGLRLERAVEKIQSSLRAIPEGPEDAYYEAMRAFDMQESDFHTRIHAWIASSESLEYPNLTLIPEDTRKGDPFRVVRVFYAWTFLNACRLRRDHPMIYFHGNSSRFYPHDVLEQFASITRPPVLVKPSELFYPHGTGREQEMGFWCALAGLGSRALHELSHRGEFSGTVSYCRKLLATHPDTSLRDMVRIILSGTLGKDLTEQIDVLL